MGDFLFAGAHISPRTPHSDDVRNAVVAAKTGEFLCGDTLLPSPMLTNTIGRPLMLDWITLQ